MRVLLISTYELGRQPFGLASPAAWLRRAGAAVDCLDLSVQELDESRVRRADAIGLYLPMHTAARLALAALPRIRDWNPQARVFAWGLYATVAEPELTRHGADLFVGGEFEGELVRRLFEGSVGASRAADAPARASRPADTSTVVSHEKLGFMTPDRADLPALGEYARLRLPDGTERIVGATEASRGCLHLCRHCPVVPIYGGRFRVVQPEVVLDDVAQMVEAGAEHVTFGDPDFLNGPGHARRVVRDLHARFPDLSYDVTIKVEHLLRHADMLPLLHDTGCVLVTSAVESIDDRVLEIFDKGHTRDDFVRAVESCRAARLPLQPTFVPFHPWMDLAGYQELLACLADLDLVGNVAPIQLAIRLLIPRGSRLLELPETQAAIGAYDEQLLGYGWEHADPAVDELQRRVERLTEAAAGANTPRGDVFRSIWKATEEAIGSGGATGSIGADLPVLPDRSTVPYLTEPWYC